MTVELGVLTPASLSSRDAGEALLRRIVEAAPSVSPERYGNCEPIRMPFDVGQLDRVLESWRDPFLWRRSRPRTWGSVNLGKGLRHSDIYISSQIRQQVMKDLLCLVEGLARETQADFAYVHGKIREDPAMTNAVPSFGGGLTTHELRRGLPGLCWVTIFGAPYVELFGRDRLLQSPAYVVREIDDGHVYIQLSEDIADLTERYVEVDAVREKIKRHLDCNAFFQQGGEESYNVPPFVFKDGSSPRMAS